MSQPAIDASDSASIPETLQSRAPNKNVLLAAKGGGITFAGKLFTYICRFVITLLLARLLGAEQYGLYNLALTAITVTAALAAFGLDSALVRYIAMFARRRDDAGLWGVLQIGLSVTTILSVLLSAGLFILAEPIAQGIFHEPRLAPLLRVAGLIVPFLTLSNTIAAATQGFKRMQYATIARDILQPLLRLTLVVGLTLVGMSAAGAVAVFGIAVGAASLLLLYFLNKLFLLRRPLREGRRDTHEVLRFSIPVFLSDLMTTFRENIQTLILGALNTATSVGIFAVVNQINMVGSMFQSAIATASRPIISELYDQGEWQQMGRMYQTTTKWTFTVNLPLFLTAVLFSEPILSIFGKSFVAGSTALALLAWAIMADISTGMCGIILDMTGHTTLKLVNAITRLVLSLVLSFLLIPPWGVVGAAAATLIVVAFVNLLRLLQVFFLFRYLPYNKSFAKPLAAGVATLSVVLLVSRWFPDQGGIASTASQVVILFVVYTATILLLGLSAEDRAVLGHLRKRMSPRKGQKK